MKIKKTHIVTSFLSIVSCGMQAEELIDVTTSLKFKNGECLDILGGATSTPYTNWQPVGLFTCHGSPNQRFNITKDGSLPLELTQKGIFIQGSQNTINGLQKLDNYCIDSTTGNVGDPLIAYQCHYKDNQTFKIRQVDDKYYYMQTLGGLCASFNGNGGELANCDISDESQVFTFDNTKKMIHFDYYNKAAYNFQPKLSGNNFVYQTPHGIDQYGYIDYRWPLPVLSYWNTKLSGDITEVLVGGFAEAGHNRGDYFKTIKVEPGERFIFESHGSLFNPSVLVTKNVGI